MPTTRDELERAIRADPAAAEPYAVYADWLSARGNPHGELIQIQLALEERFTAELQRQEATLLVDHADELLGGLAQHPALQVTWRRGFVDSITLNHGLLGDPQAGSILATLLRAPAGLCPVRLVNHGSTDDWGNAYDYVSCVDALVEAEPPLRTLVADFEWPPSVDLGALGTEVDVRHLWSALPRLQQVRLRGHEVALGAISLPDLKLLELRCPYGPDDDTTSLARAQLPSLETLYVDRCSGTLEQLQPLLTGRGFSSLRHLTLRQLNAEVIDAFAESPLVAQLETLELTWIRVHGQAAPTLDRDHAAFQHLERFTLLL